MSNKHAHHADGNLRHLIGVRVIHVAAVLLERILASERLVGLDLWLIETVDAANATQTIKEFNASVDDTVLFDPTVLDGKCTVGLKVNKSNWSNQLDTPPYKAYPVTCGITFTYAGLKIDESAAVLDPVGDQIPGLYACGELVGGVFFDGYPGGSGLMSGAVFGRMAGRSAGRS